MFAHPDPKCLQQEERQILTLVRMGLSDNQIAVELSIPVLTVKGQLRTVSAKLAIPDRLGLAFYAGHHKI